MILQKDFLLKAKNRGFHLITDEILKNLPQLPQTGLLNLFIKHTSAALTINENVDLDVREDLESIFNHYFYFLNCGILLFYYFDYW